MKQNIHDYQDILNRKRPVSKNRHPMPRINRAAQFSSFAALKVHKDVMNETERWTDEKLLLDEDHQALLNHKLQMIRQDIMKQPSVAIEYFQKDLQKEGGQYVSTVGTVAKIDDYEGQIILTNGIKIAIHDIYHIDLIT